MSGHSYALEKRSDAGKRLLQTVSAQKTAWLLTYRILFWRICIDRMKEQIQEKYNRIKADVRQIVADELQRIQNDPALAHLI